MSPTPPPPVSDNGTDSDEVSFEKVKAKLKQTRMPRAAFSEEDLEDEPAASAEPAEDEDVGTKSVILNGEEINLTESSEVTQDQVKAMLHQTQQKAGDHCKMVERCGRTPSRAFRTMRQRKKKDS